MFLYLRYAPIMLSMFLIFPAGHRNVRSLLATAALPLSRVVAKLVGGIYMNPPISVDVSFFLTMYFLVTPTARVV